MSFELSEGSVYEPFQRILLVRQRELDEVLDLCCYAIKHTCHLPDLVDAITQAKKMPSELATKELEDAERLAFTAIKEVNTGFANIFEMATVLLWGALETATRDFVALWIAKYPQARKSDAVGKVKLRFVDFSAMTIDQLCELVVEQIERETAAPFKKGVGRFDSLLSVVGISVTVNEEIRQSLLELSEVRNVLVHRAGVVDKRILQSCPWLQLSEKSAIRVSRDMYKRYNQSVRSYAAEVLRTAATIGVKWDLPAPECEP